MYQVCGLSGRFRGSEHVLQILVFVLTPVNQVLGVMLEGSAEIIKDYPNAEMGATGEYTR